MVERGVQPDLVADCAPSNSGTAPAYLPALFTFIERGAIQIDPRTALVFDPEDLLEVNWTAASVTDLRQMDELALQQLPAADSIRRRWLQHAPQYFHRQRPLQRVLEVRQEELDRFMPALKGAISAGKIQPPATLTWQARNGSKQSIALEP